MRTVNSLVDLWTKRFIPIAMRAKHVTGLDLKKPLLFEDKPQFNFQQLNWWVRTSVSGM